MCKRLTQWWMLVVSLYAPSVVAQQKTIEEIVVTAQRVEQSAWRVPIAISAFSGESVKARQILTLSDVQAFVPNLSVTENQGGGATVTIRGIGGLNLNSLSGAASVQVHVNDVPLRFTPLTEFYDLERLEVLRGPQGTLFGRNATAGTVNLITRRPRLEGSEAEAEIEVGNYDLVRLTGAGELTVADDFGLRIAGIKVDRDGYIDNLAAGYVPEVDGDLDGRDYYSFRITPRWRVTHRTNLWGMWERMREDDDRVRISNQVCKATSFPLVGCDPDAFGLEAVNQAATSSGILAAFNGMIPLGASDASTGLTFDLPRPELGLREQHTDLEPIFELEIDQWVLGLEHSFDFGDFSLLGGYREFSYLSRQDRYMDVGLTLNPTELNPSGLWPTSLPPEPGKPYGGACPAISGLAGVHGGCVVDIEQTRFNQYDDVYGEERGWSVEAKLSGSAGQAVSWLVGAQYQDSEADVQFFIPDNTFDAVSVYGVPLIGLPPVYPPAIGFVQTDRLESYALFGEAYWQATERIKLTAGLRYTDDKVSVAGAPFGPASVGLFGGWLRTELAFGWLFAPEPSEGALALTDYYGVTQDALSAASFDELVGVLQQVPPLRTPGEAQGVLDLPGSYSVDYFSGRLGVDWQVTPETMLYAFYNSGKKPGGFDTFYVQPTRFDDETVDAFELGAKSLLLDGSLQIDLAAFYNLYNGLQYAQQSSTPTENIDADIWGIELASRWRPTENLSIDMRYGYLNSKIQDFSEVDLLDVAQNDPSVVALKDIDVVVQGGAGRNYVAPREAVLAITPQAIEEFGAIPAPGAVYPDGIPVYFDRPYLERNGIPTANGVPVDLDGNSLPIGPPHQIGLGVAYTWFLPVGALTARWDFYWQDRMYARHFERPGDEIDSWTQHNASLRLESPTGRWSVTGWVRNIENEDNVTGHYVEEPVSGAFRNYFLTEPRVYGATLKVSLGAD